MGVDTLSSRPFDAETGEQFEMGVKYQPTGYRSQVSVAAFNLTRQNVVTTNPITFAQSQIGETRSRGFEIEAVANILEGLDLIGAYTRYDLDIKRNANPALLGKIPTGTPEHFGSLWLNYTIPNGTFRGLGAGGGVRFVGRSFADEANTFRVPSYTVADAALHFERGNWRVALNVSNLFDRTYVGSCSGTTACYYGDRRRATASVSYRW